MSLQSVGQTQRALLQALLRNKTGLTVDQLTEALGVSRNAVRQHLAALEQLGWVVRGPRRASGGRPEQLYVLSETGFELFPRQYSWFSELLLDMVRNAVGNEGMAERLGEMGRSIGDSLRKSGTAADRVKAVSDKMVELGYDANVKTEGPRPVIEAHNCVFHQLAMKSPEICKFDIAMLEGATGAAVEHTKCMARGDAKCCFEFRARKKSG
jgi:predicted ArsR family transcriptional regulator